jgi:hypothetical protein
MTLREFAEGCEMPSRIDLLAMLDEAAARWNELSDGGVEMCAAFDVALLCYALSMSRKVPQAWKAAASVRLDTMRFRPSPMFRTQRDVLRDMAMGRAWYFAARERAS